MNPQNMSGRVDWRSFLLQDEGVYLQHEYKFYNMPNISKGIGSLISAFLLLLFDIPFYLLIALFLPLILTGLLLLLLGVEHSTDILTEHRYIRSKTNHLNMFTLKSYNYNHIDSTGLNNSFMFKGRLLAGGIGVVMFAIFWFFSFSEGLGDMFSLVPYLLIIVGVILVAMSFEGKGFFNIVMDSGEVIHIKGDQTYINQFSTELMRRVRNVSDEKTKDLNDNSESSPPLSSPPPPPDEKTNDLNDNSERKTDADRRDFKQQQSF